MRKKKKALQKPVTISLNAHPGTVEEYLEGAELLKKQLQKGPQIVEADHEVASLFFNFFKIRSRRKVKRPKNLYEEELFGQAY